MVPLAALLLEEGHRVTGSDHTLYPPMSTTLERLGIPVASGFAAGVTALATPVENTATDAQLKTQARAAFDALLSR